MSHPSREQYLESKVRTASQPQLHVMLLDGALRFGKQAQDLWTAGSDFSAAEEPLARMFDIVEELLQGLASGSSEISTQLAEQYAFIYREVAACQILQDPQRLVSCLELLSYQRQTWKLANEQLEKLNTQSAAPAAKPATPHLKLDSTQAAVGQAAVGFSLEA